MIDVAEARIADAAEAEAYGDMCAAAPEDLQLSTGLRCMEIGGARVMLAPGMPIPMFNLAIGLGVFREATEADLDAVIAASRAAGCKAFWIHVNPAAKPPELES